MLDDLDRQILNRLQTAFPVTAEPFRALGEEMGLAEGEMMRRVQSLQEQGLIRRIGAVFNLDRLGFVSTLCAAQVSEDKVDLFVATVNALPGVTHHYKRKHQYNYWFTLICPSPAALVQTLAKTEETAGVKIIHMTATQTFKINASFQL